MPSRSAIKVYSFGTEFSLSEKLLKTLKKTSTMNSANYMLEKLSLTSREFGDIQCSPLPASVPPASSLFSDGDKDVLSLHSSGPFGTMYFHEINNENYTIRHNDYRLERDINLSMHIESQSLGLHYTLKNNIQFRIKGFPEGVILRHQYNMVYVPEVRWDYTFKKAEEYACFGIHFKPKYLQRCSESFPLLPDFLRNVKQKTPALIVPSHPSATPDMMSVLHNILNCSYAGILKRMYLDIKVPELLLLSLQHIVHENSPNRITLRESDRRKIHEVKEYLAENIDNPCSLVELAHQAGINEFKLKIGFKQLFGTTVFGYLLEERMCKAKYLLQNSELPIQEIAIITGYKNLSNFTAAFKRKFGTTPSQVKMLAH